MLSLVCGLERKLSGQMESVVISVSGWESRSSAALVAGWRSMPVRHCWSRIRALMREMHLLMGVGMLADM